MYTESFNFFGFVGSVDLERSGSKAKQSRQRRKTKGFESDLEFAQGRKEQ